MIIYQRNENRRWLVLSIELLRCWSFRRIQISFVRLVYKINVYYIFLRAVRCYRFEFEKENRRAFPQVFVRTMSMKIGGFGRQLSSSNIKDKFKILTVLLFWGPIWCAQSVLGASVIWWADTVLHCFHCIRADVYESSRLIGQTFHEILATFVKNCCFPVLDGMKEWTLPQHSLKIDRFVYCFYQQVCQFLQDSC